MAKHRHLLNKLSEREQDPLSAVIGALSSPATVDALKDLKRLELGER
ncbi:MAG: hypothetical protein QXF26_05735 [Candidatus Bathyarchaeia archaeon]